MFTKKEKEVSLKLQLERIQKTKAHWKNEPIKEENEIIENPSPWKTKGLWISKNDVRNSQCFGNHRLSQKMEKNEESDKENKRNNENARKNQVQANNPKDFIKIEENQRRKKSVDFLPKRINSKGFEKPRVSEREKPEGKVPVKNSQREKRPRPICIRWNSLEDMDKWTKNIRSLQIPLGVGEKEGQLNPRTKNGSKNQKSKEQNQEKTKKKPQNQKSKSISSNKSNATEMQTQTSRNSIKRPVIFKSQKPKSMIFSSFSQLKEPLFLLAHPHHHSTFSSSEKWSGKQNGINKCSPVQEEIENEEEGHSQFYGSSHHESGLRSSYYQRYSTCLFNQASTPSSSNEKGTDPETIVTLSPLDPDAPSSSSNSSSSLKSLMVVSKSSGLTEEEKKDVKTMRETLSRIKYEISQRKFSAIETQNFISEVMKEEQYGWGFEVLREDRKTRKSAGLFMANNLHSEDPVVYFGKSFPHSRNSSVIF